MQSDKCKELFFRAVLSLESQKQCKDFFDDVCTPKEIDAISQRFAVAKMLSEGRSYSEIVSLTGVSTATVSRVSRTMSDGCRRAIRKVKK